MGASAGERIRPHGVDFVMQSELALKRKVEGGAGHDHQLSAAARRRGSVRCLGELRRYCQDRDRCRPAGRANHVAPVTIACAVVTFLVMLIAGRSRSGPVAMSSAAIGAAAAPVIFEVPFDLIVMSRTYPALPPDPALYRLLFLRTLVPGRDHHARAAGVVPDGEGAPGRVRGGAQPVRLPKRATRRVRSDSGSIPAAVRRWQP